ncbi:MAG: flagellar basal-body MS-ring/collar protein FliF [Pseudomonadota bacterium]
MDEILASLKSFGIRRLASIVGISIGAVSILGLIVFRLSSPDMGILYANLDYTDAQQIASELDQQNMRYSLHETQSGISIMVEKDQVAAAKLSLAGEGVSVSTGVGYELFDTQDTFATTSFHQNINRLRALEGELARTINSISGVRSTRVHLVLPERSLFDREQTTARASIVVDAPRGLDPRSVKAISNLVASAVPNMNPTDVTILDSSGSLLASGGRENDFMVASSLDEKTVATERRLRIMIEDLVGKIVGPDNLRVQVSAELDLNRVTENAEIIDPDSQTILSSTVIEEASNASDTSGAAGVTVANALPGENFDTSTDPRSSNTNQRTEEVTNYEISRTVRNEIREMGGVKRLSVAVAVNRAPEVRSPEELARIEALIKSAIGFDGTRGDQVNLVETTFADTQLSSNTANDAASSSSSELFADPVKAFETIALGIIALAVIVFVLRPMLLPASDPSIAASTLPTVIPPATADAEVVRDLQASDTELNRRISLAQVEGQVKASSLQKVTDVVKAHSNESASILKSWIREAM